MRRIGMWTVAAAALLWTTTATAASPAKLVRRLAEPERAQQALAELIAQGAKSVPHLIGEAAEGQDIAARGWAIVGLTRIGGDDARAALARLHGKKNAPMLVRSWAAAGRVNLATGSEELIELAGLLGEFPALDRPLKLRFSELASSGELNAEAMLLASSRLPQLQASLSDAILARPADELARVMRSSTDDTARRQAAAYLATMGGKGKSAEVAAAVAAGYAFDPEATTTPWDGGALYVPGIAWPRDEARSMVGSLVEWFVFVHRKGDKGSQQQLHNNLRSLQLARAAGYSSPGWSDAGLEKWLLVWASAAGKEQVRQILERQGVQGTEPYSRWYLMMGGTP